MLCGVVTEADLFQLYLRRRRIADLERADILSSLPY